MNAWRSYLGVRDPTVKFAVALALSLLLVLVIDPLTPILFLALTVPAALALGRVPAGMLTRGLAVLGVVGLGFVWSNAILAVAPGSAPLAEWGPIRVSEAGLRFGIAIALRGLAIGALSLTFVWTTDPTQLAVSFARNARVPARLAYPLLAAYRFLPFFADEYAQIRLARRVRGIPEERGPLGAARARLAELVPLLAHAVRRASAMAVAMDARGFAAATARTYFREARVTPSDIAFAAVAVAIALSLLAVSAAAGWLRIWDGRFAA